MWLLGAGIVLLSALTGVVRTEEGTTAAVAMTVLCCVANALLAGPGLWPFLLLLSLAVLVLTACVAVLRGILSGRRSRWTDRSLVVVVLAGPLAVGGALPCEFRMTPGAAHSLNMMLAYGTAGWIVVMICPSSPVCPVLP